MPSRPMIVWRAVLSAFCASLIGIGLARFAYTPLLPALIGAHWFEPAAAAYLGAANLAGYLLGALSGRPLSARMPLVVVLRAMMLRRDGGVLRLRLSSRLCLVFHLALPRRRGGRAC